MNLYCEDASIPATHAPEAGLTDHVQTVTEISYERRDRLPLSPEEEELAKQRNELALLQTEVAERELYLANLRADLSAFEGRYLREVGVLYAELDDWNARIAKLGAEEEGTVEDRPVFAAHVGMMNAKSWEQE